MNPKGKTLSRWTSLSNGRTQVIRRCETYARWTLPYLCPRDEDVADNEQTQDLIAVGPRGVNHLANMVVKSLFPQDRPFFAMQPTIEAEDELREKAAEEADAFMQKIREQSSIVEQRGMRMMNLVKYRPQAINAAKHLIVTGNAVVVQPDEEDTTRIVYGIKDFVCRRDVSGTIVEAILRDSKLFGTLPEDIQQAMGTHPSGKKWSEDDPVRLFTHLKRKGKFFIITQAVDDVELTTVGFPAKSELINNGRYLFLTWTLQKGDHYGRGLVEDNSALFHVTEVSTRALLTALAIVADIKFLVNPASDIDVKEMNESASGTYHSGREGDITTVKLDRVLEIDALRGTVDEYERRIAMVFLLTSTAVRDAERVTAQEVRHIANELETSFGGIYSKFAADWQLPEAQKLLRKMNFNAKDFDAEVVTGIESMSRTGLMDNLRIWQEDLMQLNGMPEAVLAEIHLGRYAAFTAANRMVPHKEFLKTPAEKKQEAEQRRAAEQEALSDQAGANIAVEAGKQAVQEGQ
jgi:hypothetical protein